MGKQDELLKLDRMIKDLESRSKTFKANIDIIQKEVNVLIGLEKLLEENMSFLKKTKDATIAMEYKKSKEDLKKTKSRLSLLKIDLSAHEKTHEEIEDLLKKNTEAYDKLSKQNDNNVLQGKFGKKNV